MQVSSSILICAVNLYNHRYGAIDAEPATAGAFDVLNKDILSIVSDYVGDDQKLSFAATNHKTYEVHIETMLKSSSSITFQCARAYFEMIVKKTDELLRKHEKGEMELKFINIFRRNQLNKLCERINECNRIVQTMVINLKG